MPLKHCCAGDYLVDHLAPVAATLAAALVAYDTFNPAGERLADGKMLNAVPVLMLVTSIPWADPN
jgi:hypothetical protein